MYDNGEIVGLTLPVEDNNVYPSQLNVILLSQGFGDEVDWYIFLDRDSLSLSGVQQSITVHLYSTRLMPPSPVEFALITPSSHQFPVLLIFHIQLTQKCTVFPLEVLCAITLQEVGVYQSTSLS